MILSRPRARIGRKGRMAKTYIIKGVPDANDAVMLQANFMLTPD